MVQSSPQATAVTGASARGIQKSIRYLPKKMRQDDFLSYIKTFFNTYFKCMLTLQNTIVLLRNVNMQAAGTEMIRDPD